MGPGVRENRGQDRYSLTTENSLQWATEVSADGLAFKFNSDLQTQTGVVAVGVADDASVDSLWPDEGRLFGSHPEGEGAEQVVFQFTSTGAGHPSCPSGRDRRWLCFPLAATRYLIVC